MGQGRRLWSGILPVLPHSRCASGHSPLLQLLVARTSLRENAAPWRFLFAHPACHLERSRNPSETRARGEGFAPRISRDEDVSKVVRPRFRMGLKPTALLRHAAKVRLAWRLAQNDTGRDVAEWGRGGGFGRGYSLSCHIVVARRGIALSFNSLWRGLRFEKTPHRDVFSLLALWERWRRSRRRG